ncbi:hypothetical protein LMG33818_000895 [Halomonadaceae bacterium LMG 33818]|uniref:minor capsid protein n=1 Tax=Cernens ardua TaxID=3402176 RepID=UPI003EDC93EE
MDKNVQHAIELALIQHTAYAYRVSTATVRAQLKNIDQLVLELTNELQGRLNNLTHAETEAFIAGKYTTARLKGVKNIIDQFQVDLYNGMVSGWKGSATDLAGYEAEYTNNLFHKVGNLPEQNIKTNDVYQQAMNEPVQVGAYSLLLLPWMKQWSTNASIQVYGVIQQGLSQGQPVSDIMKSMTGTKAFKYKDSAVQPIKRLAETIIRTGRHHISSFVQLAVYEALGIKEVIWKAQLESSTCKLCAIRDGTIYRVGERYPKPPAHPNCKCALIPLLPGESWSDDKTPSFTEWFRQQGATFQKNWLGIARYKLYTQGKYTLDRFADPSGEIYTLDELREMDKSTFDTILG